MQIGIALFVQLDMLRGHMRLYPASAKIMDYLKRRHVEVAEQEYAVALTQHRTRASLEGLQEGLLEGTPALRDDGVVARVGRHVDIEEGEVGMHREDAPPFTVELSIAHAAAARIATTAT